MIEAIAVPLAALVSILSAPVAVGGGPTVVARAVPADRRMEPADRQGDGKPKDTVDPCPTKLWTIPIELSGLACILLLPTDESGGNSSDGMR